MVYWDCVKLVATPYSAAAFVTLLVDIGAYVARASLRGHRQVGTSARAGGGRCD